MERLVRFNDKINARLAFSQINLTNQQALVRLADSAEQYYTNLEKEKEMLERKLAELQFEVSNLRSKDHTDPYSFADTLPEDDGEVAESIENVARLEKQNAVLKEKNSILLKTNHEYKKRLEALTKGNQKYTVNEHVAIFKDDTSAPSVVNFAQSDDPEYEQVGLTPELKFPVVTKLASLLNRFEEKKFQHMSSLAPHADLFIQLAEEVRSVLAMENKVLELRSPVYIFGDIHGNYKDLKFYLSRFNPTGRMGWLPHKLLYLGDYVDRGEHSIEVVTRLFVDKICSRTKVFLLRGNHELSYVNSQVETYGQGCFRYQCQMAFKQRGDDVFWAINRAFDCLPLAAIIDHELFCVHGGIPRPNLPPIPQAPPPNPPFRKPITVNVEKEGSLARMGSVLNFNFNLFEGGKNQQTLQSTSFGTLGISPSSVSLLSSTGMSPRTFYHTSNDPRIDAIRSFPVSLPGTLQFHESCPLLSDLLWADPAPPDRLLDANGYCVGVRGPDSVMFGQPAIDQFLRNSNLTLLIRGHEDQTDGMQLSLNGKCFTVFSSSNYRDSNSGACLLCHDKKICLVIKQCNLPKSLTHSSSGTRFPKLVDGSLPELSSQHGGFLVGERGSTSNLQNEFRKVLMAQPNSFSPVSMPVSPNYNANTYVVSSDGQQQRTTSPNPRVVTGTNAVTKKSTSPTSPGKGIAPQATTSNKRKAGN